MCSCHLVERQNLIDAVPARRDELVSLASQTVTTLIGALNRELAPILDGLEGK
jgi:hypothetical protein